MSQALTPKEIAKAAAQGVAIALNARKGSPAGPKKEELFVQRPIICGIPPEIFEVAFNADPAGGGLAPGEPIAAKE